MTDFTLPPAPPAPLLLRWLGALVDWTVIAIGATIAVLVFFNVCLHLFSKDLAWVTELGELLMVWVTFLGGAAAARRGNQMSITEFIDKFSPAHRRWADVAVVGICVAMLSILVWLATGDGQLGKRTHRTRLADGDSVHGDGRRRHLHAGLCRL